MPRSSLKDSAAELKSNSSNACLSFEAFPSASCSTFNRFESPKFSSSYFCETVESARVAIVMTEASSFSFCFPTVGKSVGIPVEATAVLSFRASTLKRVAPFSVSSSDRFLTLSSEAGLHSLYPTQLLGHIVPSSVLALSGVPQFKSFLVAAVSGSSSNHLHVRGTSPLDMNDPSLSAQASPMEKSRSLLKSSVD